MRYSFLLLPLLATALFPVVASAHNIQNVFHLMQHIKDWIGNIMPVAIGIVLVVIMWHIGQFVLHADDEKEREEHKKFIIWAVVAVFGIIAFWGIVYAILTSFFSASDPHLGTPGFVGKDGIVIPASP